MRVYRRTEHLNGYTRITEVTDNGWRSWVEYEDGGTTNTIQYTWARMGWNNLDEFLRAKNGNKRFILVEA